MAVDGFPISRGFVALVIAVAMAGRGLKKQSLSKSGAMAAFAVGLVSFLASYRMGITLILFYQSSSSLTKVGNAIKKKLEADHKEGGQRGADQVQSRLSAHGAAVIDGAATAGLPTASHAQSTHR